MNPRATLKLSHFLNSGNKLFKSRLLGENNECRKLMSSAGISTARQSYGADGKMSGRIFADYAIFKGKAALSASPVLPTFSKLDSGHTKDSTSSKFRFSLIEMEHHLGSHVNEIFTQSVFYDQSGYTKVDRRGSIMLSFRPAIGERKYDSEKKQLFALSVTEVGAFISLGPGDSCEFFHDPSMKSRDAGQVRKNLSIKPYPDGYFISLSVTNNILKTNERFTVPVTNAEFAVMRAAFSFALPHIMGWAHSTNQASDSVGRDSLKVYPQLAAASEWDR